MFGHGADNRLGEGARLAGNADQDGRLGVAHDVQQTDLVGMVERPALGRGLLLEERLLKRGNAVHALDKQAVAIDEEEAPCRFLVFKAGVCIACEGGLRSRNRRSLRLTPRSAGP